MSSSLDLRDLSHAYRDDGPATLSGVSLAVPACSMVAVLGPSGSGKSTLLRVASGLVRPASGDVLVDGRSVLHTAPESRGMTMMFQKPLLFPHLDVLDNIAFPIRTAGLGRRPARAAAERFLSLVHLDGLGGRRSRDLSGGQEQRVALARALAAQPRVLLLDEPFSALDTELRSAMHGLLEEVRAILEPTVVMVTHDIGEAAIADAVAVLDQGHMAQHGTLDELYAAPASRAVARLLGGFNEVAGESTRRGITSPLGLLPLSEDHPAPTGPVTVLVRQEDVVLSGQDDPAASGTGVVVRTTRQGPRWVAHVEMSQGDPARADTEVTVVRAELPVGVRPALGDLVGLRVAGVASCLTRRSGGAPGRAAAGSGGGAVDEHVGSGPVR